MIQFIQNGQVGEFIQQGMPAFRILVLEQIHEAEAERNGERRIPDEAGDDMRNQPVAFERRQQGLNAVVDVGGQRCIGNGQKCNRHGKGADDPVAEFVFDDQINSRKGSREKYQGFIEVG